MTEILLKDPRYVRVQTQSGVSFGGNQAWFRARLAKGGDTMAGFGCGSIAAADFMLYCAGFDPAMQTPAIKQLARNEDGSLTLESYVSFASGVFRRYARPIPYMGMTGLALARGLNRYFRDHAIERRAEWRLCMSADTMLERIGDMLARNLPVITVIPALTHLGKSKTLAMKSSLVSPKTAGFRGVAYNKMAGHLITVTALRRGINDSPALEVSSWGRRYFIDYADYRRYINWSVGLITSSIIFIK